MGEIPIISKIYYNVWNSKMYRRTKNEEEKVLKLQRVMFQKKAKDDTDLPF